MKWLVLATLAALNCAGPCNTAQREVEGSGRITEARREVDSFTGVKLTVVGDLRIEIADREGLQIVAEDNLLEYIETEVVDGVLEIKQRGKAVLLPKRPVRYHVTMRKLDRVEHGAGGHVRLPLLAAADLHIQHRGSGQISANGMEVGMLSIHSSGSGDVVLDQIATQQCRFTLSGSGNVRVQRLVGLSNTVRLTGSGDLMISEGSVVQQSVIVSGSGDFQGKGLRTSETEVMVSGSGSAFIYALDRLDATVTGRGEIGFRGNPHVTKSITGPGNVKNVR